MKIFSSEDILNAKSAYLYDNGILYIVDRDDEAYGFTAKSTEWFHKENFWDYFDSELMLTYLTPLSKDDAVLLYESWTNDEHSDARRLDRAIIFAVEHHSGQFRKGTTRPYIFHPLEAMQILHGMGADINLQIAGVLHDTIEDTDATEADIRKLFGDDVAALVTAHSEDKSKTWDERKTHAIEELATADKRLKMLIMADKVSNLRSMAADFTKVGASLWNRFNAPERKQSLYYNGIVDALSDMRDYPECAPVYWEMIELYKDLFVKFYKSCSALGCYEEYLVQVSSHGEAYLLTKGCLRWAEVVAADINKENCETISRKEAEAIEDEWNKPFWECHHRDLQAGTYTISNTKDRHVAIKIKNGLLTLDGEDFGSACEAINGTDEYEYHISFDDDNTHRLLVQLRMEYGTDMSLRDVFLSAFGTGTPSSALMYYCNTHSVEYSFINM